MGEFISVGGIGADVVLEGGDKLAQDLAKIQAATKLVEAELARLQQDLRAGTVDFKAFDAATDHLATVAMQLAGAEQAVTAALAQQQAAVTATVATTTAAAAGTKAMAGGFSQVTNTAGHVGRAMMQFGYAIDDVQYGFQGVVNNIAPFVMSITAAAGLSGGMGAGIAAGAQVGGVALMQLYSHWDKVMYAMGVGIPTPALEGIEGLKHQVKTLTEEIDALHKKWVLTAAEFGEIKGKEGQLGAIKREMKTQEAFDKVAEGQSKAQRERGGAFAEAIQESGGTAATDELYKAVERKAEREGEFLDDATLQDLSKKRRGRKLTEDELKTERATPYVIDPTTGDFKTVDQLHRDLIVAAGKGSAEARDEVAGLLDDYAGGFGASDIAARIRRTSPESIAGNKEREAHEADQQAAMKRRIEAEEKAQEEQAKERIRERTETARETKRIRQDRLREAKEKAPGIEGIAERLTAQGTLLDQRGIAHEDPVTAIRRALEARGMDANKAVTAGADLAKGARQSIGEKLARGLMGGEVSHAAQFDASELAARAQAGVSNNPMKTTEDLLKEVVQNTKEMAKAKGKGVRPEWELIH